MPIRLLKYLSIVFMLLALGCQTTHTHHIQHKHKESNNDPYEGYNRVIFGINKGFDTVLVKPIAYVYIKWIPYPIQYGIGNFFDNMREVTNVANDLLQLEFALMMHDTSRFLINSTIGIFGFFDPASALGLEHRKEDFGQTLHAWGWEESTYIILPFLGPSTIRDGIGMGVDFYALSIWPWINSDWRYAMMAADYLDIRARILRKESVLDVVTLDEYVFMRNAYFQHRKFLFEGGDEDDTSDDNDPNNDSFNDIFKAEKKTAAKVEVKTDATPSEDATKIKIEKTDSTSKADKTKKIDKVEKAGKTDKNLKAEKATNTKDAQKADNKADTAKKTPDVKAVKTVTKPT